MKLRDYVLGQRVVLHSPNSREWIIGRIDEAAGSMFNPFRNGVGGGVYFGRLRLAWDQALFGNGFRPVLRGWLVDSADGTELRAKYGAPSWLLAFYGVWYLLLLVFSVAFAIQFSALPDWAGLLLAILVLSMLWVAPFLFHLFANASADEHLDHILHFLKVEAEFD